MKTFAKNSIEATRHRLDTSDSERFTTDLTMLGQCADVITDPESLEKSIKATDQAAKSPEDGLLKVFAHNGGKVLENARERLR